MLNYRLYYIFEQDSTHFIGFLMTQEYPQCSERYFARLKQKSGSCAL
jgi:hypothetical protein